MERHFSPASYLDTLKTVNVPDWLSRYRNGEECSVGIGKNNGSPSGPVHVMLAEPEFPHFNWTMEFKGTIRELILGRWTVALSVEAQAKVQRVERMEKMIENEADLEFCISVR